ncbi:MAG: hypothetical protein ACRDK3_10255 [Actinomycetota bacterium]
MEAFLDEHHHVFLHKTPTHASWLNQVELFLSIVSRRACSSTASSIPQMILRQSSSPSSTTTTAPPSRFAGPTMADPSR